MDLERQSDSELMQAVAEGRMECLGELVHRHQDDARRLAFRLIQHWSTAEDVVQDAFLRVLRSADRYRPDAAFKTWLYRIVINLCLDARRRLRNQPVTSTDRVDQPDPAGNPDSGLEENELIRRVRRALRELPERQCVALVLHRYHGLSYRGIAEATGWSVPAVESLIVRAFAQLRAALSDIREESAS